MKILTNTILCILSLTLIGCYNAPKVAYQPPEIDDLCRIHEPTASEIPLPNEANVKLTGKVKAYAVNRYIDPSNPKIMHERHVVYRVEEDPSWRLAANEGQQILIGNTLTNGKLNYNPALLEKELAVELQRQRLIKQALQTHSEILIDSAAVLSQDHNILQSRSEQLRKALEEQNKVIENLKDRIEVGKM